MADAGIVAGETIEAFQRLANLGVGPMRELVADARQRVFIDLRIVATEGFQQIDVFLQAGFDPSFTAPVVQVAKGFIKIPLQGMQVRMLSVAVAQALNQIGEQAGDCRVQPTAAAQFIVEVVSVDEVGEAIEIRIAECIAGQFVEYFVGGLQEAQQG